MITDYRIFRVFVSSTFSDMKAERDVLQRAVFPRLRKLAAQNGCRFQAIDLRWGVREEAALDQQTMKICLTEIAHCQQVTPRPNFMVLLGDRYGWRPLPGEIPAAEHAAIAARVSGEERALLDCWYRRDDNAVPPVFELQPREGHFVDPGCWAAVERSLLDILERATADLPLSVEERLKYGASATEQEIARGALAVPDAGEHVLCWVRERDGVPVDERARDYLDLDQTGRPDTVAKRRLADLKRRLQEHLPGNVIARRTQWNGGALPADYLRDFGETVYQRLAALVEAQARLGGQRDAVEEEAEAHERFAAERRRVFFGRADALAAIIAYASSPAIAAAAAFGVVGAMGSGKSALIAKAAEQLRLAQPQACIVQRYIGATPASSNGRSLLESLCQEIALAYGDDSAVPGEWRELAQALPRWLGLANAESPLIVLLDALDQLSEADNASDLYWLPARLPPHVRLVCTAVSGEYETVLARRLPPESLCRLAPMRSDEGGQVLDRWLVESRRCLGEAQRAEILGKLAVHGLPLWLKLAFEEARLWKSHTSPERTRLETNPSALIRQLFQRLAAPTNHGPLLVERSLGYLAAGRHGLTEDELLDVLALDDELIGEVRANARHMLTGERPALPVVIWSRLHSDLAPYLSQFAADATVTLNFFHRQIGDAARSEFLGAAMKPARHKILAKYFGDQPLETKAKPQAKPNLRKLAEQPFQQAHAGDWRGLHETLTQPEILCAICERPEFGVEHLLADLGGAAVAWYRDGSNRPPPSHKLVYESLYAAVWAETTNIRRHPELAFQQIWNRVRWREDLRQACHEKFSLYSTVLCSRGRTLLHSRLPPRDSNTQTVRFSDRPVTAAMSPFGLLVITQSGTWSILDPDGIVRHEGAGAPGMVSVLRAGGQYVVGLSGQNILLWRQNFPAGSPFLFRTGWPVSALDLSVSADRLIVGGGTGEWIVYSLAGPKPLRVHQGTVAGAVGCAAIAADGKAWMLSCLDGSVWLADGDSLRQVSKYRTSVRSLSIAADARRYLVVLDDGGIEIRTTTNTVLYRGGADFCAMNAVFQDDGSSAVAVDDNGRCIRVSEANGTWHLEVLFEGTSCASWVGVFSDNESLATLNDDGVLHIMRGFSWSRAPRRALPTLPFGNVVGVAKISDGSTLIAEGAGKIYRLGRGQFVDAESFSQIGDPIKELCPIGPSEVLVMRHRSSGVGHYLARLHVVGNRCEVVDIGATEHLFQGPLLPLFLQVSPRRRYALIGCQKYDLERSIWLQAFMLNPWKKIWEQSLYSGVQQAVISDSGLVAITPGFQPSEPARIFSILDSAEYSCPVERGYPIAFDSDGLRLLVTDGNLDAWLLMEPLTKREVIPLRSGILTGALTADGKVGILADRQGLVSMFEWDGHLSASLRWTGSCPLNWQPTRCSMNLAAAEVWFWGTSGCAVFGWQ